MVDFSTSFKGNVFALYNKQSAPITDLVVSFGNKEQSDLPKTSAPKSANIINVGFNQQSFEFIRSIQPKTVISPAISAAFDCFELAERLQNIHFKGAYRISMGRIPAPEIVLIDVKASFPALKIRQLFA